MKKLKMLVFSILTVMLMVMGVNAKEVTVTTKEKLAEALTTVSDGDIINIGADITITETIVISGAGEVIVNGNGNEVSTSAKKLFELKAVDGTLDITFNNIDLTNNYSGKEGRCLDTRTDHIILNVNGSSITATGTNSQPITIGGYDTDGVDLNITNSTTTNSGDSGYAIITFVPVDIEIEDSTIEGWNSLYFKPGSTGSTVVVNDSILRNTNVHSGNTNNFATISFSEVGIDVEINNSTLIAHSVGEAEQRLITSSYLQTSGTNDVLINNSTIKLDSKNYIVVDSTYGNAEGVVGTTNLVFEGNIASNVAIPKEYLADDAEVTIKLNEDMNLTDVMDLAGNITIDLNGYNIVQKTEGKNVFNIQDGNINITGSGKIISHSSASYAIRILGSGNRTDREYTVVNIGEDVTVESNGYGAYISTVDGYKAYGVQVDIYGTLKGGYNGFYVTGNIQDNDEEGNFTNFPVVNIHDGAYVEGVYAAGYAIWNIGAATIEDKEYGVGIKAGNFVVDGATITATGEKEEPSGYGDGINGTGSAIQFETNAKYADNIDVTLKNVTVSSANGYAILEYLGQTKILNLEILSGTFKSAKDLEIIKVSENFDKTGFIKGGTYSADVKEYIATGLVSKKIGDMYTVGEEYSVELNTVANGTVKISSTKAFVGEKITLTLKPNDGYELSSIKVVDTYNKEVSVTGNEFVMPNSNVKVVVEFKKITITSEIPVIDPDKKVEETVVGVKDEASVEAVILDTIAKDTELSKKIEGTSVKVEVVIDKVEAANVPKFVADSMKKAAGNATITNFFDITIALKNATGTINETISELTKEIELMVVLPEELRTAKDGMTRKYYIVREHEVDGKSQVDLLDAKVSEDGKYLTFKTDKFSTYAIAIDDQVLEQTPDNGENSNTPSTPQTGDNVMLYISLGFISVATIGISLMNLKRRSSKN